jgi:hypothetical protein
LPYFNLITIVATIKKKEKKKKRGADRGSDFNQTGPIYDEGLQA